MELTTLIVLLAVALVVMAIVVGALVVRLIHKNNELKEKNDVIVREVRRNQRLIDRAVQQGVSRAAMLSVALLCMVVQGAWAEDVNYIYYKAVDFGNHASLNKFNDTAHDPTVLTSKLLEDSPEDNLNSGWYVLNSTFSYGERIVISGDVNLILKDGCTLTAEQGIRINTDATLTIYAQSEVEGTMGKLVAIETHHDKAAIGGNKNWEAGRLFIHGGEIEATCKDGSKYAAGIGGGYGDGSGMKEITIYSGKVTAQGASYGAGIGGGKNNNHPGTINIYGGTIKANGGKNGAGIGGGENRDGWTTTINGGKVTAWGLEDGAGIGGGKSGNGGTITINDGDIDARCILLSEFYNAFGAGIGGGNGGDGGIITIHGGKIYASGNGSDTNVDVHTIYGAAGIGGGYKGAGGTIVIDGGEVTASDFNGHTSHIGKGSLGRSLPSDLNTPEKAGTLTLGDNMQVIAPEYGGIQAAANRVTALQRFTGKYYATDFTVKPCTHGDYTYTLSNDNTAHTAHCKYCLYTGEAEAHDISDAGSCSKCGYDNTGNTVTLTPQVPASGTYMGSGYKMVKNATYVLPICSTAVDNMEFAGWLVGGSMPSGYETSDSETLLQPGAEITVDESKNIYARYRYVFKENWQWWIGAGSDQVAVTVNNGSGPQLVYATVTSKVVEATATTPGYTVYTATANYKPNGYTYTFTDEQTVVNYATVELNEEDNTTTLETSNGLEAKAALTGRTLYKNGNWNTLCLPFDVADISSSPLAGATIKEFIDVSFKDGTLTLTFADATTIKAGQAYLIKWDSGSNLGPSDLVFTGVTLAKDLCDDEITADDKGSATVTFMGTYKKLSYSADDKSILFLGAGNTLYYPKKGATIGAQRAYFKLSGITAGDKTIGSARTFVLDLGDEDNVTGIIEAEANSSLFTLHSSLKEAWYSLDGRKLAGKPTQKGLYINKGVKIVIK